MLRYLNPLALVAGCMAGGVALGQTPTQHQLSFPHGLEFDNNPGLTAGGGPSVWLWRATPRYSFSRRNDSAVWSVTAAANLEFSNNRALSDSRQDPSLALSYASLAPRGGWNIDASAAQASTRATELEQTGLVTLDSTQTTYALGWKGQQALAERWTLSGGVSVRDIRYDTLALVEHRTTLTQAALAYDLSERETVALQAGLSRYMPGQGGVPGAARSSTSSNLTASYTQELSPVLEWGARLGLVRVTGANADASWQGGVSLTHNGQRFSTTLDAGRNVISSGLLGGFATNHALRASVGYALSERTRMGSSLSQTRNVGNSPTRDTATLVSLSATTELTPYWQAVLSLQQRQAERATGKARGQIVGVQLIYTHPDW